MDRLRHPPFSSDRYAWFCLFRHLGMGEKPHLLNAIRHLRLWWTDECARLLGHAETLVHPSITINFHQMAYRRIGWRLYCFGHCFLCPDNGFPAHFYSMDVAHLGICTCNNLLEEEV